MGFLAKLKGKQHAKSSDEGELDVVLKTEKELSEEQKKAIISTVKSGVMSGLENSAIAIRLIMQLDIIDMVILNRFNDGIEVIF